jgi:hypothetical protein
MITLAGAAVAKGGSKTDLGGGRLRNRGRTTFRAFISAALRSNSDFVTGQTHRSISGSVYSNNTAFVDERTSGPAVDEFVVAERNKER